MTVLEKILVEEAYLKDNGWLHVMTELDGCDTWAYDHSMKESWPYWAKKLHGTQHYWDREEAVALQTHLDRYK